MQLPQPKVPIGSNKVGTLSNYQQTGFMNADRQYEQDAHDRNEVAVAEASAQTQATYSTSYSGSSCCNHSFESPNRESQPEVSHKGKEVC